MTKKQMDEFLKLWRSSDDEIKLIPNDMVPVANDMVPDVKMMGWVCQVCGSGLSPYVSICPCQTKWEVTCGVDHDSR